MPGQISSNAETVIDSTVPENPGLMETLSVESLQGLPSIDESLLTGEETKEEKKEESTDDEKTASSGSKDASDKTEEKVEDKTEEEKSEEAKEVIPKGYVKLEALKESSEVIKSLKSEINKLKVQVYETQKAPEVKPLITEAEVNQFKDFKVLSDTELEELMDEDPSAGLKYTKSLTKFNDFTKRLQEQKTQELIAERENEQVSTRLQSIYDTAASQMEEAVPGIFDNDEVQQEFQEFAKSIGFTDDMFYLTNPETRVIFPGETEALVLGEQAASIIKMLANAKKLTSVSKTSEADIAKLTKEIEAKLRIDIEKELIKKFKGDKKEKFTSISDVSTSEEDNKYAGRVLTDREFSKLSEAEQAEYLKGP